MRWHDYTPERERGDRPVRLLHAKANAPDDPYGGPNPFEVEDDSEPSVVVCDVVRAENAVRGAFEATLRHADEQSVFISPLSAFVAAAMGRGFHERLAGDAVVEGALATMSNGFQTAELRRGTDGFEVRVSWNAF